MKEWLKWHAPVWTLRLWFRLRFWRQMHIYRAYRIANGAPVLMVKLFGARLVIPIGRKVIT